MGSQSSFCQPTSFAQRGGPSPQSFQQGAMQQQMQAAVFQQQLAQQQLAQQQFHMQMEMIRQQARQQRVAQQRVTAEARRDAVLAKREETRQQNLARLNADRQLPTEQKQDSQTEFVALRK